MVCGPGGVANCFAQPCRFSSCTDHPEATCVDIFCGGKAFVNDKLVANKEPCTAVYLDPDTGKRVNCGPAA